MRKLVPILLFGAVLLAGCQQENAPAAQEESFDLGFNVGLALTKGEIGEGQDATRLYVCVFNASGAPVGEPLVLDAETPSWNPTVKLIKNTAYTIAFWAQSPMAVNYEIVDNQIRVWTCYLQSPDAEKDHYDAFWGTVAVAADGSYNRNVTLTRPFAQIKLAVSADTYPGSHQISQFTVTGCPNLMNLLTGEVGSSGSDPIFEGAPTATRDITVDNVACKLLSSVYVLAGPEVSTLPVSFTVADKTTEPATEYQKSIARVSVQRNKQSFIFGNLFSN